VTKTTIALLGLVALAACGDDHDHDHHDEHDEEPTTSFTRWSATHELFVDHPVLVVGRPAPLAAHLTWLEGHAPVTDGPLTVELRQADGSVVTATAARPERPGLFLPALTPTVAGACTMVFRRGGEHADELVVDACRVHAPGEAVEAEPEEPAGRIAFFKEQAWTTDLATAVVATRAMTPTLRATGELRAMAGREARITATAHGRLQLPATPLVLGMAVTKGQVLATIVPKLDDSSSRVTLQSEVRAARAELKTAQTDLARSRRLREAGTIPQRQLEEAEARVEVASAKVAAAQGRLGQFDAGASGRGGAGAFQIRSAIAGSLATIHAASGQSVEDGEVLFTVVDPTRMWLHADVFEPDIAKAAQATGATFRVDGYDEVFRIAPPDGRVVTIGQVVDERTRTVPLIFELGNPEQKLRIGSFATVFIELGAPLEVLAIPESAIVRDAGRPVAYVQVEGESFERRVLELGIRAGGWVEVKGGLAAGDRVVTTGAYDVKLAAAGGSVPEHGHAH
jgi:RND family efflux transporter MFP subunit